MTRKSARREYQQAVAEFELSVRKFAEGMRQISEPAPPENAAAWIPRMLGPSKPARRAPRAEPSADNKVA